MHVAVAWSGSIGDGRGGGCVGQGWGSTSLVTVEQVASEFKLNALGVKNMSSIVSQTQTHYGSQL